MKKIGIMGGTFDPIHRGHLMLGQQAYEEYKLDSVWYMPSRQPPHKKDHPVTPSAARCAMIDAAIAPYPYFVRSDFELDRAGGNTYTADTLRLLKEMYPDITFYFIMGADSVMDIEKWYRPEYVMSAVTLMAADRECEQKKRSLDEQIEYLSRRYGAHILRLHCMELDVASADIRERIRSGQPVADLIPNGVLKYIRENHLYEKEE